MKKLTEHKIIKLLEAQQKQISELKIADANREIRAWFDKVKTKIAREIAGRWHLQTVAEWRDIDKLARKGTVSWSNVNFEAAQILGIDIPDWLLLTKVYGAQSDSDHTTLVSANEAILLVDKLPFEKYEVKDGVYPNFIQRTLSENEITQVKQLIVIAINYV